jgi:hypothetical protein
MPMVTIPGPVASAVTTQVKPVKAKTPADLFPTPVVPDTSSALNTVILVGGVALGAVLIFAIFKAMSRK